MVTPIEGEYENDTKVVTFKYIFYGLSVQHIKGRVNVWINDHCVKKYVKIKYIWENSLKYDS